MQNKKIKSFQRALRKDQISPRCKIKTIASFQRVLRKEHSPSDAKLGSEHRYQIPANN
jgi:hypothetical protein